MQPTDAILIELDPDNRVTKYASLYQIELKYSYSLLSLPIIKIKYFIYIILYVPFYINSNYYT